jgi:hypothetical protein
MYLCIFMYAYYTDKNYKETYVFRFIDEWMVAYDYEGLYTYIFMCIYIYKIKY